MCLSVRSIINSDDDILTEVEVLHGVLEENWLNEDWAAFGLGKLDILLRLLLSGGDLGINDWALLVLHKVDERLLGDIGSFELSNDVLDGHLLEGLHVSFVGLDVEVRVIIWESLIELGDEGGIAVSIAGWGLLGGELVSLDHHGNGDVVVICWVLGLISVLLEDGVEGIVTNHLSERLEGDGLNVIEVILWGAGDADGLHLVNWDLDVV